MVRPSTTDQLFKKRKTQRVGDNASVTHSTKMLKSLQNRPRPVSPQRSNHKSRVALSITASEANS